MRSRMAGCAPALQELAQQITDDAAVVYRPLEWVLLEGDWHRGRIVLLGDAVHATTPASGQGAGLAIEDARRRRRRRQPMRTARALGRHRNRRFDRCAWIAAASSRPSAGDSSARARPVDNAKATAMFVRR
jgi:2-polyprenyl-6-methoxyphenol hydroxylase-like FAD-dependent oxidoreductase